ncbi:enolase family protein [Histomonas meleagridis]|nr:enolase family protein [Histomonas meleagridis]KAH0796579.1 enolase family protein [Histomonas meleagridis]
MSNLDQVIAECKAQIGETSDPIGTLSRLLKAKAPPATIDHLVGREVLDSRGNPTVETDVYVNYLGTVMFAGRSSAPSGASTGSNEARELRDGGSRYGGKGTQKAASNVTNILSPALKGMKLDDLKAIDAKICETDGTELKEKVGGNACTATSFAIATAAANIEEIPLFLYFARQYYGPDHIPKKFKLPTPFFNILNGGKHAGGNLKLQEFMASPAPGIPYPDQLRMVAEVYQKLGAILVKEKGVSAKNLGDEGGFAPCLETPEEAITFIERAIKDAGYEPGKDIRIGLDAAASEFYDEETKLYEVEIGVKKTGDEMIQYWADLIAKHPCIVSIEDGLHEKDYEHWTKLNATLGSKVQLVGDDLYTTNPKTIRKGIEGKWCNALLLKVNQIGTISEAMEAAKLILDAGQNVMVSHRSGETCNSVIADIVVGIGAQQIKTGSTARGERIEKYTRLLQIYEYLKEHDMLEE